jgi:hypothetical protein
MSEDMELTDVEIAVCARRNKASPVETESLGPKYLDAGHVY